MSGTGDGSKDDRIEPIVILLVSCMFVLLGLLVWVAKFMSSDGQTFQVIAGLLAAFSGSLFTRIKPKGAPNGDTLPMPPSPAKITTKTASETTAETLPEGDK